MVEKLIWTRKALCDLKDIFDYIDKDSHQYSILITEQILDKAKRIITSPLSGKIVPEFQDPKLREILFKSYRIIYKLDDSVVYIVRVYHSSRLLGSI